MMPLESAEMIAREVIAQMKPYCQRISVAGSVRRKKHEVKDIEVVYAPVMTAAAFTELHRIICRWEKVKGMPMGKYTKRKHPGGITLDLFQATLDNWGMQLAIRTGSVAFSRKLAGGWFAKGYSSEGGILYPRIEQDDPHADPVLDMQRPVYMREERDVFAFVGREWLEPEGRG